MTKTKNKTFSNVRFFSILVFIATLLMGVGYASISSITLDLNGKLVANVQKKVFITDVVFNKSNNANVEDSDIINAFGTNLNSNIVLSDIYNDSSITYTITIKNNTDEDHIYKGAFYGDDVNFYSNNNITFVLDGLKENYVLDKGEYVDFDITFKYATGVVPSSDINVLMSYINFRFDPISLKHNDIIPEGGIYIKGAIPGEVNNHDMTNAITYTEGQAFPEPAEVGDIYRYGDYEYVYGYGCAYVSGADASWTMVTDYDKIGWGVKVLDDTKDTYSDILEIINNGDILHLESTFRGCTNLVIAPEIPDSVITMKYTFIFCENLVEAPIIPDSVTDISGTFINCASLVNVPNISSSVTNMHQTFSGCTSLVSVPKLPDSVTNMRQTFYGCTSLVNAPNIPNSTITMTGTFYNCKSLKTATKIPNSVTDMEYTFYGCSSLENAPEISNSVISMRSAFYNCASLVNVPNLPDSVENMQYTFRGCGKLANVPEIPDSVTNMTGTFYNCKNLTGVIKINSKNVTSFSNIFYNTKLPITLEVPEGTTTHNKVSLAGVVPSNVTITPFTIE